MKRASMIVSLLLLSTGAGAEEPAGEQKPLRHSRNCRRLDDPGDRNKPLDERDMDPELRTLLQVEAHKPWLKRRWGAGGPDIYTLILDGVHGTFDRVDDHTYPGAYVRVCVTNLDYRLRYGIAGVVAEDLTPPSGNLLSAPPATQTTKEAKTTDLSAGDEEAATPGMAKLAEIVAFADVANASATDAHAQELAVKKMVVAPEASAADLKQAASDLAAVGKRLAISIRSQRDEKTQINASDLASRMAALATLREQRQQALATIDDSAAEVTGEVPIMQQRAQRLTDLLVHARAVLANGAAYGALHQEVAAVRAALEKRRDAVTALRDETVHLEEEYSQLGARASALQATARGSERAALQDLASSIAALQPQLAELHAEGQQLVDATTADAPEDGKEAADVDGATTRRALAISAGILNHFAAVDHNVIPLTVDKDKIFEVAVRAWRLSLSDDAGTPVTPPANAAGDQVAQAPDAGKAKAGAPAKPAAQKGAASPQGPTAKPPAATDGVHSGFHYARVADVEWRQKFQVRSLAWVRVTLGVSYTSLHAAPFQLRTNDTGAQVIARGDDSGVVPMLVLSHYWCGVDLREWQPYHRFRRCGAYNTFLPTVMIGVPLDRNPVKNLFFGAMWTPVPGLAMIGGGHLGEIPVLNRGFVEGQQPPLVQGQAFDVQQSQHDAIRLGWFVGAALTDSLFVSLFSKLLPKTD